MRIYVASSWRNYIHPKVVERLRELGHETYDFKRDETANFHWSEVGINSEGETFDNYVRGVHTERAWRGYMSDYAALADCDVCVLVLPCGRSSHLELGYAAGRFKKTAVLFQGEEVVTPELMYLACDKLARDMEDLETWLLTLNL